MIKEKSLKIFLSNGITLTVGGNEQIIINGEEEQTFQDLYDYIEMRMSNNLPVKFDVIIQHPYKDENDVELYQDVKHSYFIPNEKITWFMIEEV